MAFCTQKAFQSGNVAVQSFYISKVMVKLKYTKDQSIPLLPQCSKGHFESNFILAYVFLTIWDISIMYMDIQGGD